MSNNHHHSCDISGDSESTFSTPCTEVAVADEEEMQMNALLAGTVADGGGAVAGRTACDVAKMPFYVNRHNNNNAFDSSDDDDNNDQPRAGSRLPTDEEVFDSTPVDDEILGLFGNQSDGASNIGGATLAKPFSIPGGSRPVSGMVAPHPSMQLSFAASASPQSPPPMERARTGALLVSCSASPLIAPQPLRAENGGGAASRCSTMAADDFDNAETSVVLDDGTETSYTNCDNNDCSVAGEPAAFFEAENFAADELLRNGGRPTIPSSSSSRNVQEEDMQRNCWAHQPYGIDVLAASFEVDELGNPTAPEPTQREDVLFDGNTHHRQQYHHFPEQEDQDYLFDGSYPRQDTTISPDSYPSASDHHVPPVSYPGGSSQEEQDDEATPDDQFQYQHHGGRPTATPPLPPPLLSGAAPVTCDEDDGWFAEGTAELRAPVPPEQEPTYPSSQPEPQQQQQQHPAAYSRSCGCQECASYFAAVDQSGHHGSNDHHQHYEQTPVGCEPPQRANAPESTGDDAPSAAAYPAVMCCYYKQGKCKMGSECWYAHSGQQSTPCHYGALCRAGHKHLVKSFPQRQPLPQPPVAPSDANNTNVDMNEAPPTGVRPSDEVMAQVAAGGGYVTLPGKANATRVTPPAPKSQQQQQQLQQQQQPLRPSKVLLSSAEVMEPTASSSASAPTATPPTQTAEGDAPNEVHGAVNASGNRATSTATPLPSSASSTAGGGGGRQRYVHVARPSRPSAPLLDAPDLPCHYCGAVGFVRTQEFPIYNGNHRSMGLRAHCAACLRTFALSA